jgi:hypothetical protein
MEQVEDQRTMVTRSQTQPTQNTMFEDKVMTKSKILKLVEEELKTLGHITIPTEQLLIRHGFAVEFVQVLKDKARSGLLDEVETQKDEDDPSSASFFLSDKVKKVGKVQIRSSFLADNKEFWVHLNHYNGKSFPSTRISFPASDAPSVIMHLKNTLNDILMTPQYLLLPVLAKSSSYGLLNRKHPNFWDDSICYISPSGKIKIRVEKSEKGVYYICFLKPKKSETFLQWPGPSFSCSVGTLKKIIHLLEDIYIETVLETNMNSMSVLN